MDEKAFILGVQHCTLGLSKKVSSSIQVQAWSEWSPLYYRVWQS